MRETERSFTVLGSTDLTHYGPNTDLCQKVWEKRGNGLGYEENRPGLFTAAQRMDVEGMLKHALEKKLACSAGAAAVAPLLLEL
jgi:AmmeMemoRadiSam system protein B